MEKINIEESWHLVLNRLSLRESTKTVSMPTENFVVIWPSYTTHTRFELVPSWANERPTTTTPVSKLLRAGTGTRVPVNSGPELCEKLVKLVIIEVDNEYCTVVWSLDHLGIVSRRKEGAHGDT